MELINLTPHMIKLNNGITYPASGIVARVDMFYSKFNDDNISDVSFGEVQNLPEPKDGIIYIVSGLVLNALKGKRTDLVSPATGHKEAIRDENGQILSVPGFIR